MGTVYIRAAFTRTIEEQVILSFDDKKRVAVIKGVDEHEAEGDEQSDPGRDDVHGDDEWDPRQDDKNACKIWRCC